MPVQDCPNYAQADADKLAQEGDKYLERKKLLKSLGCTCWDSDFGMDVDLCPVHGNILR